MVNYKILFCSYMQPEYVGIAPSVNIHKKGYNTYNIVLYLINKLFKQI